MAKLPDFTALGERSQMQLPRRTPMTADYRPTTGMEDFAANEMRFSGEELAQAAKYALATKEHQDTLAAEDAYTKLRQKQVDLTYGDNGFANLKGGDAVNGNVAQNYGEQFSRAAQELSDSLGNDYQKQLFAKRAALASTEMQGDIARHVVSQREPYATDVVNGTVATETQLASRNPAMAPTAAVRINAAIDNFAAQFGKPKEWADEKKTLAKSAMFSKIIEQSLDSDPAQASKLYAAYADTLTPNDRVVVGHKVNAALLPAQAKSIADYIIGGRDAGTFANLQRTLDTGGEAALVKVAQQINEEQAASPTKTRDTRAQLATWVPNAQRIANAIRPNDPVFADMVVQQVKNHVSTILAIQQGVQSQAQGQLLTALSGGPDGKAAKPTTLDGLLAQPGARYAYTLLDPAAANGIRMLIAHNAAEAERGQPIPSNAAVVREVFNRIHLPDTDPNKITRREQLTPFFAHGLNRADYDWAAGELEKAKTPEGNSFIKDTQEVRTRAHAMLLRSNIGSLQPDKAEEAAYRFNRDLDQRIDDFRKAGKDPRLLFQPDSSEYVLKPERVSTFLPSLRSVSGGGQATQGQIKPAELPKVANDADYAKLKPGAQYVAPDGSVRTKGGK